MIIIEEIDKNRAIPAQAEHDVIVMGWEDRRRTRQRVRTLKGRECAMALPTGTVLGDGEVVYVGPDFYISIEAEQEDLLVVPLRDPTSAAALGYEMGNRHLPVSISHGSLTTPYDRLIEERLSKSSVAYERREGKFEPVRMVHHHG